MQYFKNVDLTKIYPISEKAVRNWIASALSGKLQLELYEHNGRKYIANTTKNTAIIESLIEDRKKYTNTKSRVTISPKPEFYDIYNKSQIIDLISALETHREIPLKYTYLNGGADYWDRYVQRLAKDEVPNMFTSFLTSMEINKDYLDSLISNYKKVNIIDIGPGNALPVKNLLSQLIDRGVMGRYIAIDISKSMMNIAEANIRSWFGDKVSFEAHNRDVDYDRFSDLIAEEAIFDDDTVNLVFLIGGTLYNFRSPDDFIKVVHRSMSKRDYFIHDLYPDSEKTRRNFDFSTDGSASGSSKGEEILKLLGLDPQYYDIERLFDEKQKMRVIQMRLKVALDLNFVVNDKPHSVSLRKGEAVMLWRHWHKSMTELLAGLDNNGFEVLQASKLKTTGHLLTISRVKTDESE